MKTRRYLALTHCLLVILSDHSSSEGQKEETLQVTVSSANHNITGIDVSSQGEPTTT